MVSPVSAFVANLMMEELEQNMFKSNENSFPQYENAYVDDTFSTMHRDVVEHLWKFG